MILTFDDLPLDSELGREIVREVRRGEAAELYYAKERQRNNVIRGRDRRFFGDGARVAASFDPVIFETLMQDPRFGPEWIESGEFERDCKRWMPEVVPPRTRTGRTVVRGAEVGGGSAGGIVTEGLRGPVRMG